MVCFQAAVEFDVLYNLPDESTASFVGSQAYDMLEDDQQMLIDIEQNIANIERSISTGCQESWQSNETGRRSLLQRAISLNTAAKGPEKAERKRSSAFRSVKNLMKLGKQRPPTSDTDDEEASCLIQGTESAKSSRHPSDSEWAPVSRAGSQSSLESNAESQTSLSVGRKSSR